MSKSKYNVLQETIQQSQKELYPKSYAFLFVNSSSGSCTGNSLISSYIKEIEIPTSQASSTIFSIYDLYDKKERLSAFEEIKLKIKTSGNVYIIICGGDGTVQWVIQQAVNAKVNFEEVVFSVLPIGTGNDFAKSVGWGNFNLQGGENFFQRLAKQLNSAKIGNFDIWECSVECFPTGSIIEIKNGEQFARQQKKLVKNFTNYFGIGTDAQIAYIAQKLKAKTVTRKKIAYGFAGFLSFWMFCGGLTRRISQILQYRNEIKEKTEENEEKQIGEKQDQKMEETFSQIRSQTIENDSILGEKIKISKFDCCMTFLNTTSSMDLEGIWKTPYTVSNKVKKNSDYKDQSVNDGLIQIVSYRNQISLWFERAIHMAKKVGQGNGPFFIKFKQPKEGKSHQIYIHINGEPYKIQNVKQIKISQSSQFPNGKIKVLYRQK